MLWGESSAEFCAQKPAVIQHVSGGGWTNSWVWRDDIGARLCGNEVVHSCAGRKWRRVAQERSGAELGGDKVVHRFVGTKKCGVLHGSVRVE